jgi:hypothetical protein
VSSDLELSAVPSGFRETNTGLIVPEEHSREREVWTRDEIKRFRRAQEEAARKGLSLPFLCTHERCRNNPNGFTVLKRVNVPGGFELRCEHKIRVCVG